MHLTPREIDKLKLLTLGMIAERRLNRGLKLNHPEAVAYITSAALESAREGKSVEQVMTYAASVLTRKDVMDGVADTPEKMDKYIRTIYNKSNELDRLINELTFYSGIDCDRIPYHFHRMNVNEFFQDCVEEVGLDLESKNITFDFSNFVEHDTQIIADPERLRKVISNIVGNSVKYLDKEDGRIDIRILDEIDSIRVEIEDNGKGISQRDLGRIFERFYRTDSSRNSTKGGSGIGLSIVKKIIEDHGGYIWATSREGEGTCIHFVIRKYKELQKESN